MDKGEFIKAISKHNEIIAICEFGSYGTDDWIKDRSDIDLLVVNKYARMAVDSDNKYILKEERWYDFNHYVLKAARNNEKLEKTLKIDEQYSYFGGIIDESIL